MVSQMILAPRICYASELPREALREIRILTLPRAFLADEFRRKGKFPETKVGSVRDHASCCY